MRMVCLDLEGVLVPEIWIAFSDAVGIPELRRTTRDEPDYEKLMRFRLEVLDKNGLKLPDIQKVIGTMEPLPGALEFTEVLKERTQLVILSDTFEQFARPLMKKLHWPTLFCNRLECTADGTISGWTLRQPNGKQLAVRAFASINMEVFAAGDSFNDLGMIREAKAGALFRAPLAIREQCPEIPHAETYQKLLEKINAFLEA